MFRGITPQTGCLTVMYSLATRPLQLWDKRICKTGYVKRVPDPDIQSLVVEVAGPDPHFNFITSPPFAEQILGVRLPHLIMVVKTVKSNWCFDAQILDDYNCKRRFRFSTSNPPVDVRPFACTMPLKLEEGWNKIHINFAEFTRKAFGTEYVETLRLQIYPHCRIRRIYFSDRFYREDELPDDFKLSVDHIVKI